MTVRKHDDIICQFDAIPVTTCRYLIDAYDRLQKLAVKREYDDLNNVMCDTIYLSKLLEDDTLTSDYQGLVKEADVIVSRFVHSFIADTVQKQYRGRSIDAPFSHEFLDCGYELRKITGETRVHADDIIPKVNKNDKIFYKIGTVIMVLSQNNQKLIFPYQNVEIRLEQGMMVFFPPFWNYPHYTTYDGVPRYSIQTWIHESDVDHVGNRYWQNTKDGHTEIVARKI
jgi:hypothetical protein